MKTHLLALVVVLAASAASAQSAGSPSTTRPATAPSVSSSSPDSLFGLRPASTKKQLTFQQALDLAADKSWDLRILEQRVEVQDALLQRAWSTVLPQLSANAAYVYNLPNQQVEFGSQEQLDQQALLFKSIGGLVGAQAAQAQDPAQQAALQAQSQKLLSAADEIAASEPQTIEITPTHLGNAGITLVVPLFSGGAIPGLMNAGEGLDVAKASAQQARASVVLGVARAYYGAWTAQRFVAIAEEQLTSTTAHRDLTKNQAEGGLITPLALQRAELDVVRAEQSLRAAQQTAGQARANLGLLIGLTDDFSLDAPPEVPAVEQTAAVDTLIERAKGARPDLQAQRKAVEIAERSVTASWLSYLPSVALQANGRGTTFTSDLAPEPFTASVSLQASIPLYDGGLRWSQVRENNARLTEEKLRLEQLEAKIESQVRGNADDIRVRGDALSASQKALALAKATQETATKLYELGTATNLDVIDANLGLFAAELDEARAQLDVAQGRLGLAYVIGELRPST